MRKDFPILDRVVRDARPLVYLDSANTSQKPRQVLDVLTDFYEQHNSNIHRATHALGEEATEAYEGARLRVADFIGAPDASEVVFTKNSSEALNLVANVLAWGPRGLKPGDEVVITEMEHHSNIVPWQLLCERTGATLRWFGVTDEGRLDLSNVDELIDERTKVLALVHVSNVLGTVNPVAQLAARAHAVGALVVVDGSQAVPHLPVDVAALGADFYAFTGHKMCGPMGIGGLLGRRAILDAMPPYQFGGDMIEIVGDERTTWNALPHKFEAGTPNVGDAIGLAAACDYLDDIGMDDVLAHERALVMLATERLHEVDGLRVYGPPPAERSGVVSFTLGDIHPHDLATILDQDGVCIRAGHHCAQPLMRRLGVSATARASFYLYNDESDVDALVRALEKAKALFGGVPVG